VLAARDDALGVSNDEIMGKRPAPRSAKRNPASRRLLRRLQQLEKLPLKDKKSVLAIIDTYLDRNSLAAKAGIDLYLCSKRPQSRNALSKGVQKSC
jgi:hypothetical protein